MYSKEQAQKTRQQFWTSFGKYMQPVMSADGEKVNWINYRTGEKDLFFKMYADNKKALIAIECRHKDEKIRNLYFDQFLEMKNILQNVIHEKWQWQKKAYDENGIEYCCIYTQLMPVNILNQQHWPAIISFFKLRIIALDEWWQTAKYIFENLK
jgi:Domain of unknown function (DUF4268)